jgi:manganese/zinc/iron transport system ATP- binding protein
MQTFESKVENILQASSLCVHYDKNPVLWDVSFNIPKNKMVAIIGPNGAGKSTLIKTALNLIEPFSGKINFLVKAGNIAYVPQKESIDWNFPISVFEVVLMGRYGKLGYFKSPKTEDKNDAMKMLRTVGMGAFAKKQISQLSGGEKQRLFIARALMQDPDVLVLDEPFAGIDMATEKALIELFKELKQNKKSIFIVHHDLTTLKQYFDWVILLNTCLVDFGPTEKVLNKENIEKTFGSSLSLFKEANILSRNQEKGLYEHEFD